MVVVSLYLVNKKQFVAVVLVEIFKTQLIIELQTARRTRGLW